jgi:hypothetical protein
MTSRQHLLARVRYARRQYDRPPPPVEAVRDQPYEPGSAARPGRIAWLTSRLKPASEMKPQPQVFHPEAGAHMTGRELLFDYLPAQHDADPEQIVNAVTNFINDKRYAGELHGHMSNAGFPLPGNYKTMAAHAIMSQLQRQYGLNQEEALVHLANYLDYNKRVAEAQPYLEQFLSGNK